MRGAGMGECGNGGMGNPNSLGMLPCCKGAESPTLTPAVPVREGEELGPVVVRHIVRAGAEMEADRAVERRRVHGGHRRGEGGACAEQGVDRLGGLRGEEGAAWIAPEVVGGDGDVDGARCDEGDELVLVDGKLVLAAVVLVEVAGEPEGEAAVVLGYRLAEIAPR